MNISCFPQSTSGVASRDSTVSRCSQPNEWDRLRLGGEAAVAELFAEHSERLERLVEFRLDHRLRSRVDSSDVLQEAYIEIARRIDDYLAQPNVSFFVWSRQITLQTLIGVQRRHFGQKRDPKHEVRLVQSPSDGSCYSIAEALAGSLTSPSGAILRAEQIQQLHGALATMDKLDREVLALRHFEQLGNSEVAETLGLSATAASNRYVRAMSRLTEILQKLSS